MAETTELENARIIDLDEITVINAGSWLVIYDSLTNVTYRIKTELFVQTTDQNFSWVSNYAYALDEVVTYGGFWWQSLEAANLGNVPTEGTHWTKLSKSSAWGLWAAGVFSETVVFVLQNIDGFYQLFRLASPTRPFVSSNFAAEWAAGSWELASERGYFVINKAAHGFAVNDQLTFKTGAWNKFTTGDTKLAIVRQVIDANNVVVVAQGVLMKNMSGLTAGAMYYAQSTGAISTTVSPDPVFLAVSTTSALLMAAGTSSGGGSVSNASETVAGIVEEATDAEMQAGTAAGALARLFVNPAKLASWWTYIKGLTQTITNKWTFKGTSNLDADYAAEMQNLAGQMIARFSNGQFVEFGSSTGVALIQVPSTVTAGNAGIQFLDIDGIQFRLKDASSNDALIFEKEVGTGKKYIRQRRALIRDQSLGFTAVTDQVVQATDATGSAQTTIVSVPVATGQSVTFRANVAKAYATDGSVVDASIFFTAKNVGGTVTLDTSGITTSYRLPNTLTGSFSATISGTNILVRFQNEATGKLYTIFLDFTYSIINVPV